MPIQPADVDTLAVLLSPERLSKLTTLTGSTDKAIELHQETLQVGASLMAVTATIEIALRNSVCENLGHYFAVPNWLQQPPVAFQWKAPEASKIAQAIDSAKRGEYSKLCQADKGALDALTYPRGRPTNTSHLKRAKDRRNHISITEGKVIAELTLYFWKRLYGPDYDQTLWRTTLKRTFPNKSLTRAAVAPQLESIYQARNRLAHHEPVLHGRFAETIAAIEFVAQQLGERSTNAQSPLSHLLADDIATVNAKADTLHAHLNTFRI